MADWLYNSLGETSLGLPDPPVLSVSSANPYWNEDQYVWISYENLEFLKNSANDIIYADHGILDL